MKLGSFRPSSAQNIEMAPTIFENLYIPVNLSYGNLQAGF
jgi:hypothetical protein